jgi:hypothetical protein
VRVAAQQKDHQVASEPVTRYLELLMSALGSGKAHLAGADGNAARRRDRGGVRLVETRRRCTLGIPRHTHRLDHTGGSVPHP